MPKLQYDKEHDLSVQAIAFVAGQILEEGKQHPQGEVRNVRDRLKWAGLGIYAAVDLLHQAYTGASLDPCQVLPRVFTHSTSMTDRELYEALTETSRLTAD